MATQRGRIGWRVGRRAKREEREEEEKRGRGERRERNWRERKKYRLHHISKGKSISEKKYPVASASFL